MRSEFVSNEEIVQAARGNLTQSAWAYLAGASESETAMRRNRLAFDRLAFRPRILVDVSSLDPSMTFIGHKLRIPVMLAPIGSLQTFVDGGGATATKAAAEFGTMHVVSSVTEPTLEEIAAAGDNPKVFQLYVRGDFSVIEEIVGRAMDAGYTALCLTVDSAHYSRRERPMLVGWAPPTSRRAADRSYQAELTWDYMDRIKELARGRPFMLKGIATAEDAELAVDHGVDVIWVSNHGGRQLDHDRGTMDMLPEIVDAVAGRADIVLDGGIQRGGDVLKAIALGVKAVAIGKLQGWGLGAAGADGLVRLLEILEEEIIVAMALLGVTSIDQLSPNYVCKAEAVTPPHEMSTWVNMPGTRIL